MPRVKKEKAKNKGVFSQIKLGESYTSLFLGIVVVIIIAVLVFSFIKSNDTTQSTSSTEESMRPSSYVVKEGDDLWTISEKIYGSGYNWQDIANANKINNPDVISSGTELVIPDVKPIMVSSGEAANTQAENTNAIKEDSYKIVEGDNLWDISVRAYGDGYKWTEVAKANSLENPDLIYAGNLLKLPR